MRKPLGGKEVVWRKLRSWSLQEIRGRRRFTLPPNPPLSLFAPSGLRISVIARVLRLTSLCIRSTALVVLREAVVANYTAPEVPLQNEEAII
ncbi:MAG: hypothetical protein HYW48_12725 [Deltaproteobacteria bacterium]|nr:hypothetical protein [Deltaproteobacteria bacterium]